MAAILTNPSWRLTHFPSRGTGSVASFDVAPIWDTWEAAFFQTPFSLMRVSVKEKTPSSGPPSAITETANRPVTIAVLP